MMGQTERTDRIEHVKLHVHKILEGSFRELACVVSFFSIILYSDQTAFQVFFSEHIWGMTECISWWFPLCFVCVSRIVLSSALCSLLLILVTNALQCPRMPHQCPPICVANALPMPSTGHMWRGQNCVFFARHDSVRMHILRPRNIVGKCEVETATLPPLNHTVKGW